MIHDGCPAAVTFQKNLRSTTTFQKSLQCYKVVPPLCLLLYDPPELVRYYVYIYTVNPTGFDSR